jgi:hypothetical protein
MKAIKLQQNVKNDNAKLFANKQVGDIFSFVVPTAFIRNGEIIYGYNYRVDLQIQDGIKPLIVPEYNAETHKLYTIVENDADSFIYTTEALTAKEIQAKIPRTISVLAFKTALLKNHNISNGDVDTIFNSIPDQQLRERLRLMWYEATFFEIDNPYLYQFAPALQITETDIHNIFKNQKL